MTYKLILSFLVASVTIVIMLLLRDPRGKEALITDVIRGGELLYSIMFLLFLGVAITILGHFASLVVRAGRIQNAIAVFVSFCLALGIGFFISNFLIYTSAI